MNRYILTGDALLELFGGISDEHISQARPDSSIRRVRVSWKKHLAVAASVIVVISIALLYPKIANDTTPIAEHGSITPHESENPAHADENETQEINVPQPMMGKLDIFPLMNKQALYFLLSAEQASDLGISENDMLYQTDESGAWMIWSFIGDDWTMEEVRQVYGISSASDIVQISTKEKNTSRKVTGAVTDTDIISDVFEIISQADVISRRTWGTNHSLASREENDIETVLFIDILTTDSAVFSLQLYPHADCLVQNGETFYQLEFGMGEELFTLLKGCGTADFKKEQAQLEAQDNETARETETAEVIVQ